MSLTFILGGARSGKTGHALARARELSQGRLIMIATAQALDAEMAQRIARHQAERDEAWTTIEAPLDLAGAVRGLAAGDVAVIDCLTLWLTQLLMPVEQSSPTANCPADGLLQAISACKAHIYLVSNEIGLGVIPLGAQTRAFVDALGSLNQRVAAVCSHVTLMVAGLPLPLKSV